MYRNSRRMAIDGPMQQVCKEEKVEFVELLCCEAKEDMYMRDGLNLSGKGAAIFADGLKRELTAYSILNIPGKDVELISNKRHLQLYGRCNICRGCFVTVSIWRISE